MYAGDLCRQPFSPRTPPFEWTLPRPHPKLWNGAHLRAFSDGEVRPLVGLGAQGSVTASVCGNDVGIKRVLRDSKGAMGKARKTVGGWVQKVGEGLAGESAFHLNDRAFCVEQQKRWKLSSLL